MGCRHDKSLSRRDALGSLKKLNSDIVNLSDQASELPEMRVLKFIWKQKSAPVPFTSDSSFAGLSRAPFDYESKKGVYFWDVRTNSFIRKKDTTVILIWLPVPDNEKSTAVFIIKRYKEQKVSSGLYFPVLADAMVTINGKTALRLLHKAFIDGSLPQFINTKIIAKNYSADFYLNRVEKIADKAGYLEMRLQFNVKRKLIAHGNLHAEIGYNGQAYNFNQINFGFDFFDTRMEGNIDCKHIYRTDHNYPDEFNRHSHIVLYNMNLGSKIGDIFMAKFPGDKKPEYCIRFSDNSQEKLENQLITLKYITSKMLIRYY